MSPGTRNKPGVRGPSRRDTRPQARKTLSFRPLRRGREDRRLDSQVSTSSARHSRVKSSTSVKIRRQAAPRVRGSEHPSSFFFVVVLHQPPPLEEPLTYRSARSCMILPRQATRRFHVRTSEIPERRRLRRSFAVPHLPQSGPTRYGTYRWHCRGSRRRRSAGSFGYGDGDAYGYHVHRTHRCRRSLCHAHRDSGRLPDRG